MTFWEKVKDFIGIEDDYYEDEEEYLDEYEDDIQNESSFSTNENVEDQQTFNETLKEERPLRSSAGIQSSRLSSRESRTTTRSYSSNSDMVVSIKEPLNYEDSKTVIDDVKSKKTVVLNLEMLEMDKKTQIFYFVSGGVYALNGSIQNVTKDIYVLVPEGVEVSNSIKETISEKSLYQI